MSTQQAFEISDLVELLRFRATHQPDKTAFIFLKDGETEEGRLTYRELDSRAKEIALQLCKSGAVGERVILLYQPGLEYIAAFFGCLYAGVIAVPAYPINPARLDESLPRLAGIIRDAKPFAAMSTWMIIANLFFSKESAFRNLKWLATDRISIAQKISDMPILNRLFFLKKIFGISDYSWAWQKPDISPDSLAFLQYTSGSTGNPKGVMVSHRNLMYNFELIHQCSKDTPDIFGVSWLPPYHDMGLIGGILQSVYTGYTMLLMSPIAFLQKPFRWLAAISRYKAYVSAGPNFAYDLCVRKVTNKQRAKLDLSSWKIAYNGAESIRSETLDRFSKTFEICGFQKSAHYPCYGLAEGTLIASGGSKGTLPIFKKIDCNILSKYHRAVSPENKGIDNIKTLIGCGKSLTGQQIVIVNPDTLKKCNDSEVGEIWLSGPSVAKGYWEKPEATKETFQAYIPDTGEGPFLRSGDLGFMSEGELFVTGRLKDLIIIRGENHYPQDIEITVEKSNPNIRPGCVAAFSVEIDGEERLIIAAEIRKYIECHHKISTKEGDEFYDSSVSEYTQIMDAAIKEIHKAVLEQYGLRIYTVILMKLGTIPKTSSGKIQRHACRDGFLNNSLDIVRSDIIVAKTTSTLENAIDILSLIEKAESLYWLPENLEKLDKNVAEIFPKLLLISKWLSSVSDDNLYSRRIGLREALNQLDTLNERIKFIGKETLEQWKPVIDQWYKVISDELMNLSISENVKRSENPYQTGNPLQYIRQTLFKGRCDLRDTIVNTLLERHRPTLVLHGPRRMGKTSFLLQLPALLPGHTIPAFVDLQRPACTQSNASFMYSIAKAISNDSRPYRIIIDSPEREPFDRSPFEAFESWLETSALPKLQGFNLLMTFDEFEKLGEAIEKGKLNFDILDELRHLIQHQSKMAFLFAGVHTMDELGPDWSSYFINIKPVQMGYLKEDEALELIVNPDPESGFDLKYDDEVIRRIIEMTCCHPYLVQLVCSAIVEEANEIRIKLADMAILEKAISRALIQGEPYFRNVWDEMAGRDGQEILRQIAQSDTPLAFSQPEYQKALVRMVKLKVLTKHDTGTYSVEVPIVRRWIREFAPI